MYFLIFQSKRYVSYAYILTNLNLHMLIFLDLVASSSNVERNIHRKQKLM